MKICKDDIAKHGVSNKQPRKIGNIFDLNNTIKIRGITQEKKKVA